MRFYFIEWVSKSEESAEEDQSLTATKSLEDAAVLAEPVGKPNSELELEPEPNGSLRLPPTTPPTPADKLCVRL